jgi:hypothetical protein
MKKTMEKVQELSKRTLLVMLDDDEISDEDFKSAVERIWTFNKEIEFISLDRLKEIRKNKKSAKNYAYLIYKKGGVTNNYPGESVRVGLLEKNSPIYYQSIEFDKKLNEADMTFALNRLHDYVSGMVSYKKMSKKDMMKAFKEHEGIAKKIKDKTLLIDETLMKSNKLKKTIESGYKYEYKVVSKEVIDQAIVTKDDSVYYIKSVVQANAPSDNRNPGASINGVNVSAKISRTYATRIYSVYDPTTGNAAYTFGLPTGGINKTPTRLKAKDLELFFKAIK